MRRQDDWCLRWMNTHLGRYNLNMCSQLLQLCKVCEMLSCLLELRNICIYLPNTSIYPYKQAVTYINQQQLVHKCNPENSLRGAHYSRDITLQDLASEYFSNALCLTDIWTSLSSHSRVGVCSRYCLGGSGICSDPCLLWGFSHHLRLWHTPQGPPRRGVEVGWLQRGCGLREHGVQRVCRCEGESPWCPLSHEPP